MSKKARVQKLIAGSPDASVRESLDQMSRMDPVIWCAYYRRIRGYPMTFDMARHLKPEVLAVRQKALRPKDYLLELKSHHLRHRPFMIEPMRDQHPHKVYKKGRQVGVSEMSISEVIQFLWSHPDTKWIYCVTPEAEILTRRGWKHYDEVIPGEDETLGLDLGTMTTRWERILAVKTFDFTGTLNAVGPFHCTEDHRWPVEVRNQSRASGWMEPTIKRAHELRGHHRLIRMAPFEFSGHSILSPRLAAILGWVVTDGHQRGRQMIVYQSEKKFLVEIVALLRSEAKPVNKKLTKAPTIEIGERGGRIVGYTSSGCAIYGDQYKVQVRKKDVRRILASGYTCKDDLPGIVAQLSPKAAQSMLTAMMQADGCASGPKLQSQFFAKQDPRVRDAFQILCALTGRAANLNNRGAYIIEPGTKHTRIKWDSYKDSQPRLYSGTVWCPQTASGTWYMRYRGKVVHTSNTFPRDKQLQDFSTTRILPAFEETPRMRALLGTPNQVYTKRIGQSFLLLRSAWESNLGEGIDADGVTFDEKDRMKDGVEGAFSESLSSSKYGLLREVSTPSLPGRGVDASYSKSDQREWHCRCTKCSMWQTVEWPANIVQVKHIPSGATEIPDDSYEYQCRKLKCRGKLDRLVGQWVPRFPGIKTIRGYHKPQTIAPWISATQIMRKKISLKFMQLFENYVLGVTSRGENVLLNEFDFERADAGYDPITKRTSDWTNIAAGVDWGHLNWVFVTGRNVHNGKLYLLDCAVFEDDHKEELMSVKRIHRYLEPFDPDIIVADAGYGKDRNAYLLKRFGEGRFFACRYNSSTKASQTFQPQWSSDDQARVLVDRTMTLKVTCRIIKENEMGIPSLSHDKIQLMKKHFLALAPLKEEEDGQIYEIISHTGPDHLAHAGAYACLGDDKLSQAGNFNFDFV